MHVTSQANLPDLSGRMALVTGATSGIGLETGRMLAKAGAHVILAGRNEEKGVAALRDIAASGIKGKIEFERFDMADLADIAAAAARISATHDRIDILVNNAGVMMPPKRQTTRDGFELQFGTNHLGHYALTGRLLRLLRNGKARIVSVSSNAARSGKMNLDDPQSERGYSPWRSYGQSKLANLLFMHALQQASDREGWELSVVAAHPGLSATGLISSGMGKGLVPGIANLFNRVVAQSSASGAWPSIAAAVEPGLAPLSFVGPDGMGEWRGKPKLVKLPPAAQDTSVAARLWQLSEQLTGVSYGKDM